MASDSHDLFAGSRVLITGGLGFIGSNLARRLVGLGAGITLVDSLIPEYGGNLFNINGLGDSVRVNISDVRDPHSMAYLISGHDYLFNLAGQTSHLDSMVDPFTDLAINCSSQLAILEACRLHNPGISVVFASTRQIYGRPEYLPVDELHPLHPVDVNGVNKMAGEAYHTLYYEVHGLRTCSLRLTNTYGPRMRIRDARQTFLGIWIRRILESEEFEVWGGEQLRDFTFVDDAVEALLLSASGEIAPGARYNLGGLPLSLREAADILVDIHGSGSYVVKEFPRERRSIDIGSFYGDYGRIAVDLGWHPKVSLRDGLQRTLEYYEEHLSQYV